MKLRLEDITAEAKELTFVEPEMEVNRILAQGPVREYHVNAPIGVTVSYYRAGTDLFLAGSLKAQTVATCARCAEDFKAFNDRHGHAAGNRGSARWPRRLGHRRAALQAAPEPSVA